MSTQGHVKRIRQKLMSVTPKARLKGHLEYWAENEPPEKVKGLLETAQAMHKGSPTLAPPKLMIVLGMLDAERLRHAWMNDPDTLRGEGVVQHAREGHEAVHGTDEEKRQRWRQHVETYRAARAAGESKKAAKLSAAEKHGVAVRTIERAHTNLNEPLI